VAPAHDNRSLLGVIWLLVQVDVAGSTAADLPATSIFRTVNEASAFFEPGVIGYSATASGRRLDGVVLKTHSWSVAPLSIERVSSSYFADERVFRPAPSRSIAH